MPKTLVKSLFGVIACVVFAGVSFGQQGRVIAPGSSLPDVKAYDETGREFSLTELKGQYSVLVFGCLT